jgi:hypothetical protein
MDEVAQHEMQLSATYGTGAEEWYCPICGRRFIMQWPPHYKKVVLEAGDENVKHAGGKGQLCVGSAQVNPADETECPEELDRETWEDWLSDVDLDAPKVQ